MIARAALALLVFSTIGAAARQSPKPPLRVCADPNNLPFSNEQRAGFEFERQKGSHVTLRHPATTRTTVVPIHSGEFPRWLLKRIIKEAGLTEDQFRHYL